MGLQGRLDDRVWEGLQRLSTQSVPVPRIPERVVPKPTKRVRSRQVKQRAADRRPAQGRRTMSAPTAVRTEFSRGLSELKGLLRAMQVGSPVNGVTPGVTSTRLQHACTLAGRLRAAAEGASRKEEVELARLVLHVNLLVKRHPSLMTPRSSPPARPVVATTREWRPRDVSKIAIGPESSRWFMDPVNSK